MVLLRVMTSMLPTEGLLGALSLKYNSINICIYICRHVGVSIMFNIIMVENADNVLSSSRLLLLLLLLLLHHLPFLAWEHRALANCTFMILCLRLPQICMPMHGSNQQTLVHFGAPKALG